jgi:phosphoglycolate phosphatase
MKKQLLIFDFDGTIANTWVVAGRILREMSHEFSLPPFEDEQLYDLKGKHIREVVNLAGLNWWQLPRFLTKARSLFKAYIEHVPPIVGMPETLQDLRQQGYKMGILTSNAEESVATFLESHQLTGFEFILSPNSLFGKAPIIKKVLKYRKLAHQEVIMIGDEVRDINAAAKAGVDSMAVSWGFNSVELLQSSEPTHLVHTPEELLWLFRRERREERGEI